MKLNLQKTFNKLCDYSMKHVVTIGGCNLACSACGINHFSSFVSYFPRLKKFISDNKINISNII